MTRKQHQTPTPRSLRRAAVLGALLAIPALGFGPPPQDGDGDDGADFSGLPTPDEASKVVPGAAKGAEPLADATTTKKGQEPELPKAKDNLPRWVKHEIIPGETLDEIASRYGVRTNSVIRWNRLDKNKPMLIVGRTVKVYAKHVPPERIEISYEVKRGDTWAAIAKKHRVEQSKLRRWNRKVPRAFKAGTELRIWIDKPEPKPKQAVGGNADDGVIFDGSPNPSGKTVPDDKLGLASVRQNAKSVGSPNRGKISHSVQLPDNPELYTLREPDHTHGSTFAVEIVQLAIARWRANYDYKGELKIGDMSRKGGGRLRPHKSHRSGRDIDIRLPTKNKSGSSANMGDVDWDATWALLHEFIKTEQVEYVFLSTSRQKQLRAAAKRAGIGKKALGQLIQYKSGEKRPLIRHAKGHTAHFHVRINCGPNESSCKTY